VTVHTLPRRASVGRLGWVLFGVFVAVSAAGVAIAFPAERVGYPIALAAFVGTTVGGWFRPLVGDKGSRIALTTIDGTRIVAVMTPDADGLWSAAAAIGWCAFMATSLLTGVHHHDLSARDPVILGMFAIAMVLGTTSVVSGLRQAVGRKPTYLAFRPDGVELRLARGTAVTPWTEINPDTLRLRRPRGKTVRVSDLGEMGLRPGELRKLVRFLATAPEVLGEPTPELVEHLRAVVRWPERWR
jgi:hypothetical protein